MKIAAFVPAKGSSERVPSKNVRVLDGELLFRRKLKQLLDCPAINEVWLDSESESILSLSADLPIKTLKRDPSLATNASDGHEIFENECRAVPDADIVVQALCTAPFVDARTITLAVERLLAETHYDSLVGVRRLKQYRWEGLNPSYGRGRIPNSSDLPETVAETMSLYMVRRTSPVFPKKRYGDKPILFDLSEREAIDINYMVDLELAETVCVGDRMTEFNYFRVLKHHLSSSTLSDVSKEMGFSFTLDPGLRPISEGKILGRIKTLKLGALVGEERDIVRSDAWKGIYKALDSYNFVRTGDVIVVENAVRDRAYFGDLNCHLAMRAGAVGVLVDGFTRDVGNVRAMGLPVYARGAWSNDIKYEGTTLAYNVPVMVGGCAAQNDDILFADGEGILVIPKQHWPRVLDGALAVVANEGRIRHDLLLGRPVGEIVRSLGYF